MNAASEPTVKALLRESIQRITGIHVAVRYQLGRGVVRRAPDDALTAADAADDRHDVAESGDEPPSPAADQGHDVRSRPDDIERMLIDGLGAEVIHEQMDEERPKGGAPDEKGPTLT